MSAATPSGAIRDITRPLANGLAPWPGDTPFRFRLVWDQATGASVNVGAMELSAHSGTHADAPFHFQADAPTVEQLDLAAYLGPAVVVDVRGRSIIRAADLEAIDLEAAPRLLLRTDGWPDPSRFPDQFPVVSSEVPGWLGERGVILLGVDLPSVDPIESKTLENHHAMQAAGIRILEGLDLSGVPAGRYELVALPLKIAGGDGAPVRAVLVG